MENLPSTNGNNGQAETRDSKGRFLSGNPGGPGNPNVRNVATWRKALADTVSPDDVAEVTRRLLSAAKDGQPWAIHELLDRCLGKSAQAVEVSGTPSSPVPVVDCNLGRALMDRLADRARLPAVPGLAPPRLPDHGQGNGGGNGGDGSGLQRLT
jgi:hypothetical protein